MNDNADNSDHEDQISSSVLCQDKDNPLESNAQKQGYETSDSENGTDSDDFSEIDPTENPVSNLDTMLEEQDVEQLRTMFSYFI